MQMHWQMICADRQWCDFVSFDPRMPDHLMLYVQRVGRDAEMQTYLETEVAQFLAEVEADVNELQKKGTM
jgi:hypothetical protein